MGKGGEGSNAHQPVEAPNTLVSKAIGRLVFVISEGPIEDLPLTNIYLDDTAIQNPDGSFNFHGLSIDIERGNPDQNVLPGFSDVESIVNVGVVVEQATPVTRTITDAEVDAVRIVLQTGAFFFQDVETGDIKPTSVSWAIDVKPDGGVFREVTSRSFNGKTNSGYQEEYYINLGAEGEGPWDVRVRRLDPDPAKSNTQNVFSWASYTQIKEFKLTYRNTAVVGLAFEADGFGGRIPSVAFEPLGLRVQVPVNYDPATRTYTGIWDGTFKTAYTDNPAWLAYAIVVNDRWGLGRYIDTALGDKFTLYTIAQYSDEMVPDGFGGMEPRYTFGTVLETAEDAIRVIQTVASAFRGMAFWSGEVLRFSADMPTDPVKVIVPSNVVEGIIPYEGTAFKARHSVCLVTWFNPELGGNQRDIEVVEDPDLIERFGVRVAEVVGFGCRSRGLAHRLGRWKLETDRGGDIASWRSGWDQADVGPGEVVEIFDRAVSGKDWGGRILGATPNSLDLDRSVTLEVGRTYEVVVVLPNGTVERRELTSPPGSVSTLNFTDPLPVLPMLGAIWGLSSDALSSRLFRLAGAVPEEDHIFAFTATFHDPGKFDRIERDIFIELPRFTSIPTGPLTAPTNLNVLESITMVGGAVPHSKVMVSWTASTDPRVTHYQVQVRPPGENWQPTKPTSVVSGVSVDVFDLLDGFHGFRVRAVDSIGRLSNWLTQENVDLDGLLLEPAAVANLRTSFLANIAHIQWDEIQDFRVVRYEVRKGDSWESGLNVGDVAHPPFPTLGNGTYLVASYIGPTGGPRVYSEIKRAITISGSVLSKNIIFEYDEKANGWLGTFEGSVAVSGEFIRTSGAANILSQGDILALDDIFNAGGQADGTYISPRVVDVGRELPCRVSCTFKVTGVPDDQNILALPDFLTVPDVLESGASRFVDGYPIIRLGHSGPGDIFAVSDPFAEPDVFYAGAAWDVWQKWTPDVYLAQLFQLGMALKVFPAPGETVARVIAFCLEFSWLVDVPDRLDSYTNLTVPAAGLDLVFMYGGYETEPGVGQEEVAFNGGPNGTDSLPLVLRDILLPHDGDRVEVDNLTLDGCTVRVKNGGSSVERSGVDIFVQGF